MTSKILVTLLLITVASRTSAQKFSLALDLALPDSILHADAEWHDIDNDGLLDVVLMTKTKSGAQLIFSRGDTVHLPAIDTIIAIDPFKAFSLVDFNNDNKLDLLISPENTSHPVVIYVNNGELSFARQELSLPAFNLLKLGDVDNDGYTDCVLVMETSVLIFPGGSSGIGLASDTFDIIAEDLEIFDADNNGTADIFLSGRVDSDSSFTGVIPNLGIPGSEKILFTEISGQGTIGHLDNDGFLDVLFTADSLGVPLIRSFSTNRAPISIANSLAALPQHTFAGDLNLDGITDITLLGKNAAGDTVNVIQYNASDFISLPVYNLVDQVMADPEHDGDLDVLQIVRQDSLHVLVLKNVDTTVNEGPTAPGKTVAIDLFGKLLIYWEPGSDDRTEVELLTYDVWLSNGSGVTTASSFNLSDRRRIISAHGNAGSRNFKFFQDYDAGGLNYVIQSVDNAFHSNTKTCTGGQAPLTCLNINEEFRVIDACRRKNITLSGPENALWFSFKDGYRATGAQWVVYPQVSDTIFYFDPAEGSCFGLKVFHILIENDTLTTLHSPRYACEGSIIELASPSSKDAVSWESALRGNLGNGIPLNYQVSIADSVTAITSKDECHRFHITPIQISKPIVFADADRLKVLKGTSVQLKATGANHYTWEPPDDLSDFELYNPVATPSETTRYVVTGYDSLNCKAQASVTIEVEETGFIPTLFTPNDDGQNDELKIYGLSKAENISFSVFNREGTRVFHTTSLMVAMEGWNGIYLGAKQPTGVYYWKVSGALSTGEKLKLNGKESGSVVLVR